MTRSQVEHALRAAADVTGERDFFVIGSQSIHGQYPNPPVEILTVSNEVDLHASRYDPELALEIAGILGYGSSFSELHGFYVDAVDPTTATLPDGWQHRVHVIEGENTIAAGNKLRARGFCLDVHDLLVSKYAAAREKDLAFARAAIIAGYVDETRLRAGLAAVSTRIGANKTNLAEHHLDRAFGEAQRIRADQPNRVLGPDDVPRHGNRRRR